MRSFAILVLLAPLFLVARAAAPPTKLPHLDLNGDPLPDGTVVRLGSLRFQPPGPYGCMNQRDTFRFGWSDTGPGMALSPDGKAVAITTPNEKKKRVHFLDTSTGTVLRQVDLADADGVLSQFTPDGKSLVFSGWNGIQLVDAASGKVVRSIELEFGRGPRIALTSDGSWMAAQPQKHVREAPVRVWETKTGKKLASLPGRGASCNEIAFGSSGKRLLLSSMVPTHVDADSIDFGSESKVAVACIDVTTRKIVAETTVGTNQVVALSPDGETVALEAADHRSIRVRHLPTDRERCTLSVKDPQFVFAPDGKGLFTFDANGQGALWDVTRGDKVRDLDGALVHRDFVILGVSKDGRTIAVLDGGWDSAATVVVWNAATGKRANKPAGHDSTVTCLAYAPDGKWLASGSLNRTVRLWDPTSGEHLRIATVHKDAITAIAVPDDQREFASGGLKNRRSQVGPSTSSTQLGNSKNPAARRYWRQPLRAGAPANDCVLTRQNPVQAFLDNNWLGTANGANPAVDKRSMAPTP